MSAIAPTVAQPLGYDDYAAPWQVMTRLAGQALGKDAEAESLVADVEQQFADVRDAHPEFDGQTVAVVDPYEPGQYAVFAPHDPKVVFMTELGFVVPDAIVDAVSHNATEISSERLDLVDVDRLLFLTGSTDAEATVKGDAVYSSLAVAREDRLRCSFPTTYRRSVGRSRSAPSCRSRGRSSRSCRCSPNRELVGEEQEP